MSTEVTEEAVRRLGCILGGKWRLERVLGSGGMANVYAATHVNNGRTAAINVLHPALAPNAEVRSRFAREG
jgi:serine/threonine-protein kinase